MPLDTASPAGLGSSTVLGITGVISVAFGLISRSNLSRHVAVRCDKAPKHSELRGVLPYLGMGNFEMHFLLFPVISSLANFLRFLGTPVKFVNAFSCHCFLAVRLWYNRSSSLFVISVVLPGSSFPISPRTCSGFTVSLFSINSALDLLVLSRTRTLRSSLRFSD